MIPTQESVDRLRQALRLSTPIIAIYTENPSSVFEPMVNAKGSLCCFAYYQRWLKGETLVIQRDTSTNFAKPQYGCPGLQNAIGLGRGYAPWMAHFLTDGKGAPMGEGLKATPELAQQFLDRAKAPVPGTDFVLMGPMRLDRWDSIQSLTFLVDPDRLSALMTLSTYWSSDPNEVYAPFSSGCGLMWREFLTAGSDRPIISCTDIAMRKYLPPEIMGFSVTKERFAKMVTFPDTAFLMKEWWNDLLRQREKDR